MRAFLFGALLLFATAASAAETKYNIFQEGQKIGTMTHNVEGSDADGYLDRSEFVLSQDGKEAKISQTARYDSDGLVSESTFAFNAEGQQVTVVATMTADGAKVKATLPDGTEDGKDVALATDTTRKDPTWFWFKTIKPEVGAKATYQDFDIQEGKWTDVTYEFKGRTKVTIDGKEYEGNELVRTSGEGEDAETAKMVVDDQGELLVYESDDQKIERIFE